MSSDLEALLDEVDRWKLKVHERLRGLTAKQRRAYWARVAEQARAMGLRVMETEEATKRPRKPGRGRR